jgi:predicted ATPase
MAVSNEVRRLKSKWLTNTGWPKRLEWIDIAGVRGWTGQRFTLGFPIMAVVGENGVGKSTVLQCAAAVYRSPDSGAERKLDRFASDFFPDTAWDRVQNVLIRCSIKEGTEQKMGTIRKPGERWRGNPERRQRHVEYIDLSRVQPVSGRVGYTKLANPTHEEVSSSPFGKTRLARLSAIMGRSYDLAKMALTDADAKREVPVIAHHGDSYSGFHQGAGETTITELLRADLPRYSLVLIDEVESSLHPRAQRRLIRDLAERARELELQVVLTTHSPYVLEELPYEARACIMQTPAGERVVVYGVSPDFAMTKMDDVQHSECDLYVEDATAGTMLVEILIKANPDLVPRCRTIPFGASSVGQALGQMVRGDRFPRPSCVFLDGDEGTVIGCLNLPGEDAPERVVFETLQEDGWLGVHNRTGRDYANVADACTRAMARADHHEWLSDAASALFLGSDTLWQTMCAEWASKCLADEEAQAIAQAVEDAIIGVKPMPPTPSPPALVQPAVEPEPEPASASPIPANEPQPLFWQ